MRVPGMVDDALGADPWRGATCPDISNRSLGLDLKRERSMHISPDTTTDTENRFAGQHQRLAPLDLRVGDSRSDFQYDVDSAPVDRSVPAGWFTLLTANSAQCHAAAETCITAK